MKKLLLLTISCIVGFNLFAQGGMAYIAPSHVQGSVNDADISATVIVWDSQGGIRSNIDVSKQLSSSSIIPGTSNYFCWDEVCVDTGVTLSPNDKTLNTAADTGKFVAHYSPNGITGISTIAYRFGSASPFGYSDVSIQFEATSGGTNDIKENTTLAKLSESYPNPASDFTTLSYTSLNENAYIVIYDITGKEIKSKKITKGQGVVVVNVTHLENGVYFYALENSEGRIATKRLVIVR